MQGRREVQAFPKERSLRVLEKQQRQKDYAADAERRVVEYCQVLSDKLEDFDFEGKRSTLAAFDVEVEATPGEISITVVVDPNVTTIARTWALPHARNLRSQWA